MRDLAAVPARRIPAGRSLRSDRDETAAQWIEAYRGAGSHAKRSPKDRSAIPGTVTQVSKVAVNDQGRVTATYRPKRRPGSGRQDREGIGTTTGFGWGWSSYAFAQALTNRQDARQSNGRSGERGR